MKNNGWISVKDRLPEIGSNKRYPHCSNNVIATSGKSVFMAYYEAKEWVNAATDLQIDTVTHWQPLPEPPQKEATNG